MVDSKQKGTRAEILIRNRLIELSGLGWERTPGSGALDPKHMLCMVASQICSESLSHCQ